MLSECSHWTTLISIRNHGCGFQGDVCAWLTKRHKSVSLMPSLISDWICLSLNRGPLSGTSQIWAKRHPSRCERCATAISLGIGTVPTPRVFAICRAWLSKSIFFSTSSKLRVTFITASGVKESKYCPVIQRVNWGSAMLMGLPSTSAR